ncbi:MAG: DUF421 domain-containing protein [Faecalibacterium sp.]|nr:DUF421 domain-containing protein [Ruminococcus sp.]MCM1393174.1 DUF421 domain-containing protein [Ruminococcus sp.]MCM1485209.1 DUF421 domain-containing protein [Faecalibacterium sp.]
MDYLQVFLTTILSVVVLFAITRILGYRQLSEMSLFDYINGITIGSIAAELATCEKNETGTILFSMVIYGIATLLLSFMTDKSMILRRFITGKPIILLDKGKLCYKNFKKARLDINEFLMKCRNNGYFDLSQLDTAILEPNGRVSFIPTSPNKPVTASDIEVQPQQETILADVIIDGKIIESTLNTLGKDKKWLTKTLCDQGITDVSKVFLATCDNTFKITCYEKSSKTPSDILE